MQKQREHWGTQLGFILAAVGSAVGLGTLWKFPYMAGSAGGGLFVLAFFACIVFIGLPLFFAELLLGRHVQRGAVGIFATLSHEAPFWRGVGWLSVVASALIMSYYATIAGWGLNFIVMSLNQSFTNRTPAELHEVFHLLKSSADINLFWQLMFSLLTMSVVLKGIRKGIEFWSRLMTTSLFIILIGLALYSTTLPGFWPAVSFVFYPDFSKFEPSSLLDALGLAFFTLSLGHGVMLTYGSYMRATDDIPKTGFVVSFGIIVVALLASLVIFPIIFSFGLSAQAGPGLVFETLPVLFGSLPGSFIVSTAFFILFVFTALTSSIAFIEVVAANLMDLYQWPRTKAVLVVSAFCFLIGIPSALSWSDTLFKDWGLIHGKTFFETVDDLVTTWIIPIGGFLIAVYTGWFLDKEMVKKELQQGSIFPSLFTPWYFVISWIVPLAMLSIFLQKTGIISINALLGIIH